MCKVSYLFGMLRFKGTKGIEKAPLGCLIIKNHDCLRQDPWPVEGAKELLFDTCFLKMSHWMHSRHIDL